MKTKSIYLLSVLAAVLLFGTTSTCYASFNYTVSFTASGATNTVGDVLVQNITKGSSVTVPAGNTLSLTEDPTAINELKGNNAGIRISQNASTRTSILTFYSAQAEGIHVSAYSLDGRRVFGQTTHIEAGENSLELSLPAGMFIIRVDGTGYTYSTKLQSIGSNISKPGFKILGNNAKPSVQKKSKALDTATITMNYTTGDQLTFKATSGNCTTLFADAPTASKIINIEFTACQDASGNNYAVVKIGTQTWMAENLKTTKYRNGIDIPNVIDNNSWYSLTTGAWSNYDNNAANGIKYGKLYNWYAVSDVRNLAPSGWHVASDAEWTLLETYVTAHLGFSPTLAKALAATTDWDINTGTGVIGNDFTKNNSSLFGGLPGGYRTAPYSDLGQFGAWWTSTAHDVSPYASWFRRLSSYENNIYRYGFSKFYGYSVRCVKD